MSSYDPRYQHYQCLLKMFLYFKSRSQENTKAQSGDNRKYELCSSHVYGEVIRATNCCNLRRNIVALQVEERCCTYYQCCVQVEEKCCPYYRAFMKW